MAKIVTLTYCFGMRWCRWTVNVQTSYEVGIFKKEHVQAYK